MIQILKKIRHFFRRWPGWKTFFRELFFSLLLGLGLGVIFNSFGWGLMMGLFFGLASYLSQIES